MRAPAIPPPIYPPLQPDERGAGRERKKERKSRRITSHQQVRQLKRQFVGRVVIRPSAVSLSPPHLFPPSLPLFLSSLSLRGARLHTFSLPLQLYSSINSCSSRRLQDRLPPLRHPPRPDCGERGERENHMQGERSGPLCNQTFHRCSSPEALINA